MKSKKILFIALPLILLAFALLPLHAAGPNLSNAAGELQKVGGAVYGTAPTTSLPELVGKYVRIFLGLLGVIFAILMVYGGYTWMTSYGNEQKVTKAKELIIDAVIGLVIVLAAYAISSFVVVELVKRTTT